MKHFGVSFVCIGEEKRSWNVAEQPNDDADYKTTAYFGRSAKPFAGASRRIARALDDWRSIKA
jgi:hypothetical protein